MFYDVLILNRQLVLLRMYVFELHKLIEQKRTVTTYYVITCYLSISPAIEVSN